ncbi:MAG: DUF1553 domain-containing protein, partial [Planctomycetota bacterium]
AELADERRAIPSVRVPVLAERDPRFRRRTFVFEGGNWLAKGGAVGPGTPASLPKRIGLENADSEEQEPTRLDLARWIASSDNPLTSRTMVNRVWAEMFGIGLVETTGDLGVSGAAPSHPELLDHLARRFQGLHAWRLKPLLREIALSATYRQDAAVSAELARRDPGNRLLARGPRQRLSAEMIRDQALVVSGKWSPTMFGKPVMPFQPDGIWRSAYSGAEWQTADGGDRYRRAVYTYWKRTSGYPSLLAFDAPSREVCTARRVATNTPLQALVTLNDPAYVDLARGLGERMGQHAAGDPRGQIAWAYRSAAGREADDPALAELEAVYHAAIEQYA